MDECVINYRPFLPSGKSVWCLSLLQTRHQATHILPASACTCSWTVDSKCVSMDTGENTHVPPGMCYPAHVHRLSQRLHPHLTWRHIRGVGGNGASRGWWEVTGHRSQEETVRRRPGVGYLPFSISMHLMQVLINLSGRCTDRSRMKNEQIVLSVWMFTSLWLFSVEIPDTLKVMIDRRRPLSLYMQQRKESEKTKKKQRKNKAKGWQRKREREKK